MNELKLLGLNSLKHPIFYNCKVASQRVIEKNNGVLEKEILDYGETYLVYWILL